MQRGLDNPFVGRAEGRGRCSRHNSAQRDRRGCSLHASEGRGRVGEIGRAMADPNEAINRHNVYLATIRRRRRCFRTPVFLARNGTQAL